MKELFDSYKNSNNWKSLLVKIRYNKELEEWIKKETSFLDSIEDVTISERIYYLKNDLKEIQLCPYCNKKPLRLKKLDKGFYKTCGDDNCKKQGMSNGAKSPRNWEDISKKAKETYAKNHNGYTHNMKDPEFLEKFKENFKKKHNGVSCGVMTDLAKENRKKVAEEKYGSIREMLVYGTVKKYGSLSACAKSTSKERAEKTKNLYYDRMLEKIKNFDFSLISDENGKLTLKCNKCGLEFNTSRYTLIYNYRHNKRFCPKCDYKNNTFRSNFEKSVADIVNSLYDEDIWYNRYIGGIECDIIIPKLKIAIECNGVYWHSEEFKNRNFHYEKKKRVESEGYSLIQIWDDQWNNLEKREIIISRLKNKLGINQKIYARKCIVKEISGSDCRKFLNEHHLQGWCPAKYHYGLFYNNELVQVMSISRSRKMLSGEKNSWELIRLCTKKNLNIIGGFSKLISYIKKLNIFSELYSYVDNDWSSLKNNGYQKVGFEFVSDCGVDYWWNINGFRENRMRFTKHKLVEDGYDPNMSEIEIMHSLGHYRVFGSGNILYKISL